MSRDRLIEISDIPAALGLLTRLPVRVNGARAMARGAKAAWAWPLAGIVVAALAAAAGAAGIWFGLPGGSAAVLVLTVQMLATGALHEDGLADSADGLWGGWTREARLAIMKDSRTGAYGAAALALALIARHQALALILDGTPAIWAPLMAVAAGSRAMMLVLMAALPPARPDGLSAASGRPGAGTVAVGAILSAGAMAGLIGWAALPVGLAMLAIAALWALVARARLGGQTGDILGACQQLTEIAGLLALTALLP